MKLYHKAFLYRHKWIQPYLQKVLGGIDAVTFLAALALIGGVVYEHGFIISEGAEADLGVLYRTVWGVFLVQTTMHIGLAYRETLKKYRTFTWVLNILLYLTLIPVIFFEPESGALKYFWLFLNNRIFQLILLLLLSLLRLSSGVIGLLGKRTNPSLILAGSFFLIICIGTGLLMLPRCTVDGISWVNALFVSTSAVCVTGLVPVDVATTFTSLGQLVIIILIQIGGLGVMTLTCFFAMFFMGNTSVYNQLAVRDMISSDSLSSLLSTVIYILFFTLVIEGAGMLVLFLSIHGTLGMTMQQEMVFAAFHSISAFCNAGFSTLSENLGNPLVMQHHNLLYITISVLIILGGIGFPILVNFKHIAGYHLKRLFYFIRTGKRDRQRIRHLYNLNTKIVLLTTLILLTGGTIAILLFEWNGAFAGMSMPDKWVQAFFNATCPRTAGFTSIGLTSFSLQSLLLMLLLMFIGGAAQSTAGGVKVNAFAAAVLSLFAVIRGKSRVEVFRRQLSVDSIRRSNATLVMYLMILFLGVFVLSVLEPHASLLALVFECTSALSTVGSSLGLTPALGEAGKLFVSLLMFIGRVGVITIVLGFVPPQKHTKYKYPDDNLIIN
ncbi:TrkH family potassium uptake protein [Odoribacter splanchnicus]|uniref:TrkH family potassium uptake protein n=1 Tax=Odoribacter splanchnicus TaxID=28118 RepID=UPI000B392486|nr:potassium transporter TrkG [Odoribacter splanchnicus]OUO15492.1 potassium transporter [Odoribacter splanchnicus]